LPPFFVQITVALAILHFQSQGVKSNHQITVQDEISKTKVEGLT
jgi:hypothetical protein